MVSLLGELSPTIVRSSAILIILVSVFTIIGGTAGIVGADTNVYEVQSQLSAGEREPVAGERGEATVVTFSGNGPMVLIEPNGTIGYFSNAYDSFWDVDPVPGTRRTVLVSASDEYDVNECPGGGACTRNFVIKWNLTTGEQSILYDRFRPKLSGSEWHDVDAIDGDRDGDSVIIADIEQSRVFQVETKTGIVSWSYSVQNDYSLRSGGQYPGGSWTHLNDVEVTPTGDIMVSLRNQDSVIFIERTGNLNKSRTLGSDDAHHVLYEQHNPDYIPRSNGGPSVLVADSQNNRVIEYHWNGTDWNHSWVWKDGRLQWPRDADRLPNGNTLITDTNGHRIMEVNSAGEIVWIHQTPAGLRPYEAERLGTGDESENGPSAKSIGMISRQPNAESEGKSPFGNLHHPWRKIWTTAKHILPNKIVNGLLFVKPSWLKSNDLPPLIVAIGTLIAWIIIEVRRLNIVVSIKNPVRIERR